MYSVHHWAKSGRARRLARSPLVVEVLQETGQAILTLEPTNSMPTSKRTIGIQPASWRQTANLIVHTVAEISLAPAIGQIRRNLRSAWLTDRAIFRADSFASWTVRSLSQSGNGVGGRVSSTLHGTGPILTTSIPGRLLP